jgi:hypothetical protein
MRGVYRVRESTLKASKEGGGNSNSRDKDTSTAETKGKCTTILGIIIGSTGSIGIRGSSSGLGPVELLGE